MILMILNKYWIMFQIQNKVINSDIIVAPMAGISNDAFRQLCFEFNAGLVYSEMVSDKAIYYQNKRTLFPKALLRVLIFL